MKSSAFVPIISGLNQNVLVLFDNKLRYRNVCAFVSISLSTASRKTAVSIYDSLDPGPQALAGLHHGVPVEGPHHLLYLLNRLQWPILQIRHTQNSEKNCELGGQTSSSFTSTTVLLIGFSLLLSLPVDSSLPKCDYLFLFLFPQTAQMVCEKKQ